MCLMVFAYKTVPDHYLVMATNRDEFYKRPTRSAEFWKSKPGLLAGRDLKAGGTWLGIHKDGRLAALTNYRDMSIHNPNAKSRGMLVSNFLDSNAEAKPYLENLKNESDQYNGFNLILSDLKGLYHYSNIENKINRIEPGIHGLSNAFLNTSWPKVQKSKENLELLLAENNLNEQALFDLVVDTETYPDEDLPETGLSAEMERAVSASFIQTPDYGTRCSTVILIRYDGQVRFVERVYKPGSTFVKEENGYDLKFSMAPVL